MADPVPVAEKLLETKLFGISVRRIVEALVIPLAPFIIATVLAQPLAITGPLFVVGAGIGAVAFFRTPKSQRPHEWLRAAILHLVTGRTFHWQPVGEAVTVQDDRVSTGEERTRTKAEPQGSYERFGPLGTPRNTVDHLAFETVRSDGIVETDEAFVRLIEVRPRPWLILSEDSRDAVYRSYLQFLMGVKFPFQVFTLPFPFDARGYVKDVHAADRNQLSDESLLLSHGRKEHVAWLEEIVDLGEIRDRRFFVAVAARKRDPSTTDGPFRAFFRNGGDPEGDDQRLLEEVDSRAETIAQNLPKTGVETDVLTERSSVLRVLYHYYKGIEPRTPLEFDWLVRSESAATGEGT